MSYKYYVIMLFFLFSCSASKNVAIESEPIIKSITEASYSIKKSGEMSRISALENKVDRIEYYNKNGFLTEYKQFETDGSLYERTTITKNETGELIRGITYDSDGKLKTYWNTTFDKDKNPEEKRTFNAKDRLLNIQSSIYDKNGNRIEMLVESKDYRYTNKDKYKYNAKNQCVEKKHYNGAKMKSDVRTYQYDEEGLLFEEILTHDDGSKLVFRNKYDNQDNLLVQKWFDEDGIETHETSFEYVYDTYGNWITRKRSSKKELGYIWERVIEYH